MRFMLPWAWSELVIVILTHRRGLCVLMQPFPPFVTSELHVDRKGQQSRPIVDNQLYVADTHVRFPSTDPIQNIAWCSLGGTAVVWWGLRHVPSVDNTFGIHSRHPRAFPNHVHSIDHHLIPFPVPSWEYGSHRIALSRRIRGHWTNIVVFHLPCSSLTTNDTVHVHRI